MQTIKGLIILLVVAVVIFTVVAKNDNKSYAKYAAKSVKMTVAETVNKTAPILANSKEAKTHIASQANRTATNVINEARRKISSM